MADKQATVFLVLGIGIGFSVSALFQPWLLLGSVCSTIAALSLGLRWFR